MLSKEYQRLGSPLSGNVNLKELIQKAEIELSKNSTFQVMGMSHFD